MDLTRLNNEYIQYWHTHDLGKALANLKEIDGYLSQGNYDTWLNSYDNLLKPGYLSGLYNQITGMSFDNIQNHISYIQLLQNFRDYVSKLIAESKAIDEEAKRNLEKLNNDWFSSIMNALSSFTDSVSTAANILPFLLLGGLAVYILVNVTKK